MCTVWASGGTSGDRSRRKRCVHPDLPLGSHVLLFDGYRGPIYPGVKFSGRDTDNFLHRVPRLRKSGALPPRPPYAFTFGCVQQSELNVIRHQLVAMSRLWRRELQDSLSGQPSCGRDLKAELRDYKSEWQPLLRKSRTEMFGSNWGLIKVRSKYIYIYIYINLFRIV